MQQIVRFTRSPDGTRLAWATSGSGPPVVKAANWLSHLEHDWVSPVWRHWFRFLSTRRRLIRYDARGCGLSDRRISDFGLDAQVADLEAVVDAAGLDRFSLLGISQGGTVAIEFAHRHPERVSRLVLYGAFARGWFRGSEAVARQARALFELIEGGWGSANPAFRRVFTELFLPQGTAEQFRSFDELMRVTVRPEVARRIFETFGDIDVVARLATLRVPALVLHAREDAAVPASRGRELSAGIPGARFVELDSRNHLLLEGEAAWSRFCAAFDEFLAGEALPGGGASAPERTALAGLTPRERQVLALLARGLRNAEIAAELRLAPKTVRNHVSNLLEKLGVDSRARAIVLAHELGLAGTGTPPR